MLLPSWSERHSPSRSPRGFSAAAIALATRARTCAKSGCLGTITGGTNCTLVTFCALALSARSTNVPRSPSGMLVLITLLEADAMPLNFSSTVSGLSWSSIAVMTQRWRAIRS